MSGLGAVVARTSGGREVGSSILLAPTINDDNGSLSNIKKSPKALFIIINTG